MVVTVAEADADVVAGLLWAAGAAGVEERAADDGRRVELRAGVRRDQVDHVLAGLRPSDEPDLEAIGDESYLDRWREHAQPWRGGRRLVVVPAWQEPPAWVAANDVVLSIDPGRAFGSGAHPTTRMCLAEVERLIDGSGPAGRLVVADVGCGSGVLAVAAARLGADRVVAIDIDPEAVRVTEENAARNAVAGLVSSSPTPVAALGVRTFDLVIANIAAATLVELALSLARVAKGDAPLVLSGVLEGQVESVRVAFAAQGRKVVATVADDDWRTLVVR